MSNVACGMGSNLARRMPGASCSYGPAPAPVHTGRSRGRSGVAMRVAAVNHDPENLFKNKTLEAGIIQRRMQQRMMKENKEYAKEMARAQDDVRRAVLTRREARLPPTPHDELVEFLLNTEAEDMEYTVARCRPLLDAEFFKQLNTLVGRERFAAKPDQERIDELDTLRTYLEEAVAAVDKAVMKMSTAAERLKKLLSSPDKKQCILDMAAANEIDQGLMDLLQQNIEVAKAADQEKAAEFMEKVKAAAGKYLITVA